MVCNTIHNSRNIWFSKYSKLSVVTSHVFGSICLSQVYLFWCKWLILYIYFYTWQDFAARGSCAPRQVLLRGWRPRRLASSPNGWACSELCTFRLLHAFTYRKWTISDKKIVVFLLCILMFFEVITFNLLFLIVFTSVHYSLFLWVLLCLFLWQFWVNPLWQYSHVHTQGFSFVCALRA